MTDNERKQILRFFRDEYGTEDIAALMSINVDDVRAVLIGEGYAVIGSNRRSRCWTFGGMK